MNIRISINTAAYDALLKRATDNLPLTAGGPHYAGMLEASDIYHQSQRDRFASASEEDGTWKPLAPSTVKQHAAIGDSPPHILHLTGDLEDSLQRSHEDHVLEITDNSVIEGTNNEYAHFHQTGGDVAGRPPQRTVYVPPESNILDDMKTAIVRGIADTLGVNP